MQVELAQIFTQIVSFLIMLWILKRFAWKPFLKILENREEKIKLEFTSIDKGKEENNQLKKQYEDQLEHASIKSKEILQKARESAFQLSRQIEEEAHKEARRILAQAEEELKNEVVKAKANLKDDLVKITLSATEKLMETSMDQDKQKALVQGFINQA